jgi:methyl-accepting chemotaxis protein
MKNMPIGLKMIGGFLALLVLVCGGLGYISTDRASQAVIGQMQENIPLMAEDGAKLVRSRLDYYLVAMEGIANRHVIRSMDWNLQQPALVSEVERMGFQQMGVATPDGNAPLHDGSSANIADREYFKQAMAGNTVMSSVIIHRILNKPIMVAAAPIRGERGQVLGIVFAVLDATLLSVITDGIKFGQSGYSYIIDGKGALIAHSNRQFVLDLRNFIEEAKTDAQFVPVAAMFQRMIRNETGFDAYSFMGSDRYFGFAPIPGTGWSIAVGAMRNDVLAPVYQLRQAIGIVSLVFFGLGIAIALLISRAITSPVIRLKKFAEAMAVGNLDHLPGLSQKDEIGVLADSLGCVRNSILNLISEVQTASHNISHGHLNCRIDSEKFQGGFKTFAEDINQSTQDILTYLNEHPMAAMVINNNCDILWMNNKGGASCRDSPVGRNCKSVFEMEGCGSANCATKKCMSTGTIEYAEAELEIDGKPAYLAYTSRPIRDKSGKIVGAFEVQADLTELKNSERMRLSVAQDALSVANRLSSTSEELAAQVEQAGRGAEEQKNRTGETATAMEEMNATVLEVARNASQAAEASDQARTKAADGAKVVSDSVAAINTVQSQAQEMKSNLDQLGRQADQIGRIMTVIEDIADQTNLLALNAAIEAARAGDAGRGFAVVADEVRKLAEKTMNATKEVGQAILAIQEGTNSSIKGMNQSVSAIQDATRLANQSGDALREILALAEQAADQVRSIATAAEQQSATSEEINRGVEDINRITSETSEVMHQSGQAISELAREALELRELVHRLQKG